MNNPNIKIVPKDEMKTFYTEAEDKALQKDNKKLKKRFTEIGHELTDIKRQLSAKVSELKKLKKEAESDMVKDNIDVIIEKINNVIKEF